MFCAESGLVVYKEMDMLMGGLGIGMAEQRDLSHRFLMITHEQCYIARE